MKILVGYHTDNEATYEYHILSPLKLTKERLYRACRYVVTENVFGKKVLYDGKPRLIQLGDIQKKEIDAEGFTD